MIDRQLKSEIAQCELSDLGRRLHFNWSINIIIKPAVSAA
jgi:hypothetical protein